jgi:hypothetical protein
MPLTPNNAIVRARISERIRELDQEMARLSLSYHLSMQQAQWELKQRLALFPD